MFLATVILGSFFMILTGNVYVIKVVASLSCVQYLDKGDVTLGKGSSFCDIGYVPQGQGPVMILGL